MQSTHDNPQSAYAVRSKSLAGHAHVPGDKSISHRALMLASLGLGTTTIHGLLEGEDVLRTAQALRQCGTNVTRRADGSWEVIGKGIGGLSEPADVLDMGNAGTAARLMMGLLSTYPYSFHFTGDDSLRKRPMMRVITPLQEMGASFMAREGGRLPLAMTGTANPKPIRYTLPVASAQVKSAIMLAALNTPGTTTIIEKEPTRDHTERMLRFFDISVGVEQTGEGTVINVTGKPKQSAKDRILNVPADPSSAAFPIVAALLVPGSVVTISNVCLNPLRTGLFEVLKQMGGDITIRNAREIGGEPVGDITVKASNLHAVDVPAHVAPSMIDEYPILAIACACAKGVSSLRGLSELRVKESDRFAAVMAGLQANGIDVKAQGDDMIITGTGSAPKGGGTVTTHYDHRIAMSFLILGLVSQEAVTVDDIRAIATSFPGFVPLMHGLGAKFHIERKSQRPTPETRMVIAIDGPAASGKGTLARRLAYHFGLGYLDTGLLYRAVGMRVLYSGADPSDVKAATEAAYRINAQDLANPKLRGERIGQAASIVSAMPEVRQALLEYQHRFAAMENGAVLDGRDVGTVICPNADYKFFITASLEARAKRRHKELQDYGVKVDYQSVYDDLVERDARDATRAIAPMKPADDAVLIDSSEMSMNEVFEFVLAAIR